MLLNKQIPFALLLLGILFSKISISQRTYNIKRDNGELKIDGELLEEHWQNSEIASDFTVRYPSVGEKSKHRTEIRMYYDNDALYVGGKLFDESPDSVLYTLSQRDDYGNADWFGMTIDPYGNNVNAFMFSVTAAGVEVDGLAFTDDMDFTWNAVWKSATSKMEDGWSFELRIPFSAIRFPNKNIQEWNINFRRQVRRSREESFWNPVDPAVFGEITQAGKLKGIQDVKSPLRLSFTPYVTGYLENSFDDDLQKQTWKQRLNGGLDLKYGLNDAFTLDMTLIPDFGQTVSDRQVLNLGPFEVRFNENRPFFLEGTDLFRIGGVFYSRRIAARPHNYWDAYSNLNDSLGEQVVSNPGVAPLLNGTKVSGRTKKGLGIGVFNAIEGRAEAIIEDDFGNQRSVRTHSRTNYNVFVLSQALKNNSQVSFVNTNVMREAGDRDANVTVGQAELYSNNRKYRFDGTVKISSIHEGDEPVMGHALFTGVMKVGGRFQYGFGYGEESDKYNPNDLGFLYNNNSRFYTVDLGWNDFTPGKHFLRKWGNMQIFYEELYKPQLFSTSRINWSLAGTLKSFLTAGVNGAFWPFGEVNHFESREFGKEVRFNPSFRVGGFYSTDYSKRFALDLRTNYRQFVNTAQKSTQFVVSPRARISDRMFAVWRTSVDFITHDYGYVSKLDDNYADDIILGFRDRQIVENSLTTEFIFTKRMGIDLRLRHYWQQVNYKYFVSLEDDGVLVASEYNPVEEDGGSSHNTNYNAFTVDINYRWVFIPGSELRLVYKNNIIDSKTEVIPGYFDTFNTLFSRPQINSVSLRLLVFVDAIYFRRKNKNRI